MSFLNDKPKYSERTITQTVIFIVGLMFLAFLFAMFESDDDIRWQELLIGSIAFVAWLIALIWIGDAKNSREITN